MKVISEIKKLFAITGLFLSVFCAWPQDFYWDDPETVSRGDARFCKAVSNGSDSYAFWQEIDKAKKSIYISVRYKNSEGVWVNNDKFAGPFSYSGEIPDIYSAAVSSAGTDKSIDNIGFWKRKAGIFREKAGFIGNIMQRACTISDKFKGFYC